jgi:hypothetical protein
LSPEVANEFEERRVARLLAGAAEAIAPLSDVEVETLVRGARSRLYARRGRRRSRGRRRHVFSVAAVAAAAAIAVSLPIGGQESEPRSGPASTAVGGNLASFPEGSALLLLLSQRGAEHA